MDSNTKKTKILIALISCALLAGIVYYNYRSASVQENNDVVTSDHTYDFRKALEDSVGSVDPAPLQNFFADKVSRSEKDLEAKSAIYWITHRYFDNGGDIYEIYDFIQARPEVAFLNDAALIYPDIFNGIKNRTVANRSADSLLALLAYYEVIDVNGYGDIALWGMAANRYAELAYRGEVMHQNEPEKVYAKEQVSPLEFRAKMVDKTMHFIERSQDFLLINTLATGKIEELNNIVMIPDDLLVGLNQYAAAVENLKSVGMEIHTPFETNDIYNFNYELASTKVPRLYFFTNYLYAASLVTGGTADTTNVALPLSRAVGYAVKTPEAEWRKSVSRVINSKNANETGMYAYETVKKLAALNPEFRNWLISQGWNKEDF